jgi:ubiquinone biosynthesis accessory factor UbiJ
MIPTPTSVGSDLANRMLDGESWARDKLAAHADRVFMLTVGPATSAFRIGAAGTFESASLAGVTPDLRLTVSPFHLPSLLADPRRWNEHVHEEGDAALGGTLKELAQTLPWFVEQAFARALGPIAGQRVADVGRRILAFPGYAAERITESVARYARDEAQLLARGEELRRFTDDTRDIAARVDALGARIDALSGRMRMR